MKVVVTALVVLLVALQYRFWFGNGSVQELWRVREEARATRAEVSSLRSRNQVLRAEVVDLKSGLDAVEERARTDLGMIDADETFYQFVSAREVAGAGASGGGLAGAVEDGVEEPPAIVTGGAPGTAGPIPRDED